MSAPKEIPLIPERVTLSQGTVLVLRLAFHSHRGRPRNFETVVRNALNELERQRKDDFGVGGKEISQERYDEVKRELNELLLLTLPDALTVLDRALFREKSS